MYFTDLEEYDNAEADPDYVVEEASSDESDSETAHNTAVTCLLPDTSNHSVNVVESTNNGEHNVTSSIPSPSVPFEVKTSRLKTINGKRYWDRKHCCIFCEKLVTNFQRH